MEVALVNVPAAATAVAETINCCWGCFNKAEEAFLIIERDADLNIFMTVI
jgi:hypothetical protein